MIFVLITCSKFTLFLVLGTPNATETARPNHIGLVPDSLNLPYDMSVREGIPVPGSSQFNRHMAGMLLFNPINYLRFML